MIPTAITTLNVVTVTLPYGFTLRKFYEMANNEGTQKRITLDKLDTFVFKNPRRDIPHSKIENLRTAINKEGMLTPITVQEQEDGTYGTVAGYCRSEVSYRNALEKLIADYNKENKLSEEDDEYIHLFDKNKPFDSYLQRQRLRDLGGEWQKKYDACLAKYEVDVLVKKIEDATHAKLVAFMENKQRQNMTLADEVNTVTELLEAGLSPGKIKDRIDCSASQVTHMKKIGAVCEEIRKQAKYVNTVKECFAVETDEEVEGWQEVIEALVREFERRISQFSSEKDSMGFSHAREISNAFLHKKNPLKLDQLVMVLRDTMSCKSDFTITDDPTMDWAQFRVMLKDAAKNRIWLQEAEGETEEEVEAVDGEAEEGDENQSTVDDAADAQTSASDEIAAANAAEGADEVAPVSSGKDDSADVDESELADDAESLEDEIEGMIDDEVDGDPVVVGGTDMTAEKHDDGSRKTKMTDGKTSRYKLVPPENLEDFARQQLAACYDTVTTTPTDILRSLEAAGNMYFALGMNKEYKEVNGVINNYYADFIVWIEGLEMAIESGQEISAEELESINEHKPACPLINPVCGIGPNSNDDEEEEYEEDEDSDPSNDELEDIEDGSVEDDFDEGEEEDISDDEINDLLDEED